MTRDPYAHLRIVGHGPKFASTDAAKFWRRRLAAMLIEDDVDVLLDDGRIVRTPLRALNREALLRPDGGSRCVVWLDGITASYAAGRVRPAHGWWRTPGCKRVSP
jgi:hypothetical protein